MNDSLRVRIVSHPETIRSEWLALERFGLCHVFQCYEWVRAWYTTFARSLDTEPCIVLVSDGDAPLFILPLCIMHRKEHKTVEFMDGGISDYTGPVLSVKALSLSHKELISLFNRICQQLPPHDCLMLRKMTADIAGVKNPLMQLPRVAIEELQGYARPVSALLSSELQPIGEAEWKEQRLVRKGRRIELGDNPTVEAFHILAGWKRAKFPKYLGPDMVEFYLQLLRSGKARLFHLYIDEQLAAAHYVVTQGATCTGLILGHDPVWRKESPGKIILARIFKLMPHEGFTVFDQGCGNEAYKDAYGPGRRGLYRYVRASMQKSPLPVASLARQKERQPALCD